jgi:hypothetical protein
MSLEMSAEVGSVGMRSSVDRKTMGKKKPQYAAGVELNIAFMGVHGRPG